MIRPACWWGRLTLAWAESSLCQPSGGCHPVRTQPYSPLFNWQLCLSLVEVVFAYKTSSTFMKGAATVVNKTTFTAFIMVNNLHREKLALTDWFL